MTLQWHSDKVRQTFIDYFVEKQGHTFAPSAPVLPYNDPTLLFINSGMAQFKDIFLGTVDPRSPEASLKRAANSQKCIRAGGKHNDLDDVGKDTYHHTYFEMLGNWSFGDYFQEEAIAWAWELLTGVFGLDPERIYVSYFCGDEEDGLPADLTAKALWQKYLPDKRILPFDKTDNFWEMGDTGPCGPCSEIHYDRIGGRDAASLVNADDPNVIEIWNLVFMQFNREKSGALTELPDKHVDTGMGFERLTSILQDVPSNYDTDIFKEIFDAIQQISGAEPYSGLVGKDDVTKRDTAYRIIADHIRTLTISITDGILPGKVGRGSVLRSIVRRAIRAGRDYLGIEGTFMHLLVDVVVEKYGDFYETLKVNPQLVKDVLIYEQDLFSGSLDRGLSFFTNVRARLERQGTTVLDGSTAFLLYSSHGFPLDLIQIICEDNNLTLDLEGFNEQLAKTSQRSREAWLERDTEEKLELDAACLQELKSKNIPITDDSAKYSSDEITATVLSIRVGTSETGSFIEKAETSDTQVGLILDNTNFYAESGGQIFDTGMLTNDEFNFNVEDVQVFGGFVVHIGTVQRGTISVGETVTCNVNNDRREPIMVNHTATHLLNFCLRNVKGEGCDQRGSLVVEDRFRFDFTYHEKITIEELKQIDDLVNDIIVQELPVYAEVVPLDQASEIVGVRRMFGEKYPDPVRTISVGASIPDMLKDPKNESWKNYSIEYCGGTHITNTKTIQKFTVIDEFSKGGGERRMSAVTGELAIQAFEDAERLTNEMNALSQIDVELLRDECLKFDADLVNTNIPAYLKQSLRIQLDALLDISTEYYKQKVKEAKSTGEEIVNGLIESCNNDQSIKFVVAEYDVEGNQKLLMDTANNIKDSIERDVAVLLFSTFPKKDRIIFFATVPEGLTSQLSASNWIKEVSGNFGGKGGGKPTTAQGFHEQLDQMENSILFAQNVASSNLN